MYPLFLTEGNILCGAIAICLCSIIYISLSQRQRDTIVRRLRWRKRRPSSVETPPRSLTPEKQVLINNAIQEPNDYVTTFPPSQRDALRELARSMSPHQRDQLGNLDFDQAEFEKSLLGFEEDFRTTSPSKYSYSGISIQEIKALGDFPNYAALSGVPLPEAYKEFNIDTAKPRPYRPFRWAYHQTMSLTKLETNWWLELESTYKSRIAQRKELYAQHGTGVLQWLPGSELACKELMEMCLQFLCARYPQYFSLAPLTDDATKTVFTNKILNTSQIVQDQHPLHILLDNVPEDFAIMLRNPETGYYHFRAGMICSAIGWNIDEKIGKQLHEIHASIPDYKEKMQFSMDRFFAKLPTFKPIQRGSWGLEVDQPLYMPPGDPHERYRGMQSSDLTPSRTHLRVDWQTLRRLPLSGAVVFNFKALFTPITEFRNEPRLPSLVLKILTEGKEKFMKYKSIWHVEHVVKPAMRQYEREQKEAGICERDWEVKTLDESPYFEGWEEKWHAAQGF